MGQEGYFDVRGNDRKEYRRIDMDRRDGPSRYMARLVQSEARLHTAGLRIMRE